jgi:hypothetical protein
VARPSRAEAMARLVPVDELRDELDTWMRRLSRAAEAWVNARAAGLPTDDYASQMEEAERHTRRLERRIKRRRRER